MSGIIIPVKVPVHHFFTLLSSLKKSILYRYRLDQKKPFLFIPHSERFSFDIRKILFFVLKRSSVRGDPFYDFKRISRDIAIKSRQRNTETGTPFIIPESDDSDILRNAESMIQQYWHNPRCQTVISNKHRPEWMLFI